LRALVNGSNVAGMLRNWALAGLVVLFWFSAPVLATEPATSFVLGNGLQVVVLPDHRLPIVTHIVYYRAGSADDPPGQSGIAHFTEHLMFKGTDKYPTGQYDLIVTRAGGTNNAFTSNDKTYYYEQFLKDGLARIMDLDADRMAHMAFQQIEAEHELKVVLAEQRTYDNDPESVLADEAGRALYGAGAYAHPVLGERAEIAGLTLPAALAFHARFYVPANAILVVAGDVMPNEVRALADATYGRLPSSPPGNRPWADTPYACAEGHVEISHSRIALDKLSLYFITPGTARLAAKTEAALQLLAYVLQDQAVSPLWQYIVAETGLASDIAVGYEQKLAAGEFSITAVAQPNGVAPALEPVLLSALDRLRENGIDAAALTVARRHWLTDRQLAGDDQLATASRYGEKLAIGRTIADIEQESEAIASVSLTEINTALRNFLSKRCFVSAALEHAGPSSAEALRGRTPAHATDAVH